MTVAEAPSQEDLERRLAEVRLERVRREIARRAAGKDPCELIRRMVAFDEQTGEPFPLSLEGGWDWQGEVIRWWQGERRTIVLKARQLGLTWLALAFMLWIVLYAKPGSLATMYRQTEKDSKKLLSRTLVLLHSLPSHLWNGAKIVKETETEIHLEFPDGKVSKIQAMTSTSAAGHGETVAFALLDEFSRIDKASEIIKSVSPAVGKHGHLVIVSTANGRHNELTGEGNYFHYLWENAFESGLDRRFLSWRARPDRPDDFLTSDPEAKLLKPHERKEQYPENANEAFSFSESIYFDREALEWYAENGVRKPIRTGDFVQRARAEAKWVDAPKGMVALYELPVKEHRYALAADVSTGRGADYSAAYVIDLETMGLVAEFHGKLDTDRYAVQLHYLGRFYASAVLAVEDAGGWGEPVIINLRDGKDGRPPYPRLYRHVQHSRADLPEHKPYGYPINTKTRPHVIEQLEAALRERALPWLTDRLLSELGNFVHKETGTSPRAQDGCHDDCVMSVAVVCDLYRQRGLHEHVHRAPKREGFRPFYPWQHAA